VKVFSRVHHSVSIHAPRAGSDSSNVFTSQASVMFQSTLPARGATLFVPHRGQRTIGFNPRSPRGERPGSGHNRAAASSFNPRSPRGERPRESRIDPRLLRFNPRSPRGERQAASGEGEIFDVFQSTLPARGATWYTGASRSTQTVSIHAPRAGSDATCPTARIR